MKKVINGKQYNTETAKNLGHWTNGKYGDFDYIGETLYTDKSGKYFLHGEGGARTCYASYHGNMYADGEKIVPMTQAEARKWAEDRLDGDEYEAAFGLVDEYGNTNDAAITVYIPTALRSDMDVYCQRTGASITDVVKRGIAAIIK